jgi:two-component system OmpR family response regulator
MNKRVLFINHCSVTSIVPEVIAQAGYYVDIALKADAALTRLCKTIFDLIIFVENPYAESWVVCEKIRKLTSVPIIVISADATPETCVKAISAGADYFMRKPFGPMEVLARVNSLLQRIPSRVLMPLMS